MPSFICSNEHPLSKGMHLGLTSWFCDVLLHVDSAYLALLDTRVSIPSTFPENSLHGRFWLVSSPTDCSSTPSFPTRTNFHRTTIVDCVTHPDSPRSSKATGPSSWVRLPRSSTLCMAVPIGCTPRRWARNYAKRGTPRSRVDCQPIH